MSLEQHRCSIDVVSPGPAGITGVTRTPPAAGDLAPLTCVAPSLVSRRVTQDLAAVTALKISDIMPGSGSIDLVEGSGQGYRPRLRPMISFWISVVPPKIDCMRPSRWLSWAEEELLIDRNGLSRPFCRRRAGQICAVSAAVKPKSLAIRIKARRTSDPISSALRPSEVVTPTDRSPSCILRVRPKTERSTRS